jgi:thymidylate synthase ThyX
MPKRDIYLLSPKKLSPETIAVAFAKTSRSPESFRDIASELSDEKSAQFHEKWVVGYGHASVAEHAVLHLAIENVSRVAIESIESNRLASYTEKSTRYQKWDTNAFTIPSELENHPLREEYVAACRLLFKAYIDSLAPVRKLAEDRSPRRDKESDEAYDRRIRSQYVDSCRFLLPAAAHANVGMTANARVLENAIRKMRSHPLAEVRAIGEEVKAVARSEVPTLVKYAEPVEYLIETSKALAAIATTSLSTEDPLSGAGGQGVRDWCTLVDYDESGEKKVLAAALYRFGEMSFVQALDHVSSLASSELNQLADALLKKLGRYDIPLRELEHASYTFALIMDQGAYAEFKRHRMMSQTPQNLTCRLGYAVPKRIVDAGFESQYRQAMENAAAVFDKLHASDPQVAQYIVPNGFNRRVLATFNLREAYAFCQLRAAANAHFSIRRIAQRVTEEIKRVHPLLAKFISLPENETWQSIEAEYFTSIN